MCFAESRLFEIFFRSHVSNFQQYLLLYALLKTAIPERWVSVHLCVRIHVFKSI